MPRGACARLALTALGQPRGGGCCCFSSAIRHLSVSGAGPSEGAERGSQRQRFDTSLLEVLVCPLSKKRLRYEEHTNELINEELGIAYPIVNGIPNMIPQDARMIGGKPEKKDEQDKQ
ncbi:protein preY, mitochondrial [Amia ocellicauda]|uniref:protein preY, mitochondrial n=1 Tax=Amia ocellicauda TaxID=2972642 RepID=UPI003464DFBF|nr:PREY protein [Amia calva]